MKTVIESKQELWKLIPEIKGEFVNKLKYALRAGYSFSLSTEYGNADNSWRTVLGFGDSRYSAEDRDTSQEFTDLVMWCEFIALYCKQALGLRYMPKFERNGYRSVEIISPQGRCDESKVDAVIDSADKTFTQNISQPIQEKTCIFA